MVVMGYRTQALALSHHSDGLALLVSDRHPAASRTISGRHSVQPVVTSTIVRVWMNEPPTDIPPCATRSTSQNPGGGSPSRQRSGPGLHDAPPTRSPRATLRTLLSIRSIVAALMVSTRVRSIGARFNRPWRSSDGSSTGIITLRRFPQTRSEASHNAISASRMASP